MPKRKFKRAFTSLKKELLKLHRQREAIDKRIAKLGPIVDDLAALSGEPVSRELAQRAAPRDLGSMGITDAVRLALKRSGRPLTPRGVRDQLLTWRFDPARHTSLLASVHTILKRLVKSGQAEAVAILGGKKAYKWVSEVGRVLASLEYIDRGMGFKG